MRSVQYKNFNKGLSNRIEAQSIKREAYSNGLNFLTMGDKMELRRGYAPLGNESEGTGKITGLAVGRLSDGSEVPFRTRGRKIEYFNASSGLWVEIGTNTLEEAAEEEDISLEYYSSLTGDFVYAGSPNSHLRKIAVANPGDITDVSNSETNFQGRIRILRYFVYLFRRGGTAIKDFTSLYRSKLDQDEVSDFTQITGETLGAGDGSTEPFSGTLAFKAAGSRRTCFGVTVAAATSALVNITGVTQGSTGVVSADTTGLSIGDYVVFQDIAGMTQLNGRIGLVTEVGVGSFRIDIDTSGFSAYSSGGSYGKAEIFFDTKLGTLISAAGGTGTINYTTGAIAINFATAPVNTAVVAVEYRWEDSAVDGILDFGFSATRLATEGFILPQNDAGDFQNVFSYNSVDYCFHSRKTFQVITSADDTDVNNQIYRAKVGISNWRNPVETGDGIYYIDDTDTNDPAIRLLTLGDLGINVIPKDIAPQVNLNGFSFDQCAGIEYGDFIVWACRTNDSESNNRVIVFNKIWRSVDVLDYFASCFAVYNGMLIAGDSVTNNVYTLFSGIDDHEANIYGFFDTILDDYGLPSLKKTKKIFIQGLIGTGQRATVHAAVGNGSFVEIGEIDAAGSYVDAGQAVVIGAQVLGSKEVGGGSDGITAYPFWRELRLNVGKFRQIKLRIETQSIGYFAVTTIEHHDIRVYENKLPSNYRTLTPLA